MSDSKIAYFLFLFFLFSTYIVFNVFYLENYNFIFVKTDIINYLSEFYTGDYIFHHFIFYFLFAISNFIVNNKFLGIFLFNNLIYFSFTHRHFFELNKDYITTLYYLVISCFTLIFVLNYNSVYMSVILLNILIYFYISQKLFLNYNDNDYLKTLYFLLSSYLTGFFLIVNIFSQYIAFLFFLYGIYQFVNNSNRPNLKMAISFLLSIIIHYSSLLPIVFFLLIMSNRKDYFKYSNYFIFLFVVYVLLIAYAGIKYSIFSKYNKDESENNIFMNLITINPIILLKFIMFLGVTLVVDMIKYKKIDNIKPFAKKSDLNRFKLYILFSFFYVCLTSHLARLLIYVYPFIFNIVTEMTYDSEYVKGVKKVKIPFWHILFSVVYFLILHFLFLADVKNDLIRYFKKTSLD